MAPTPDATKRLAGDDGDREGPRERTVGKNREVVPPRAEATKRPAEDDADQDRADAMPKVLVGDSAMNALEAMEVRVQLPMKTCEDAIGLSFIETKLAEALSEATAMTNSGSVRENVQQQLCEYLVA